MNCANHQQTPAAAYCRTCGKPLCTNCTRPVMGVIYCENCVAEKMAGTAPPPTQCLTRISGADTSDQHRDRIRDRRLAGRILSIFPGIGAVYSGLYVKGLVHLVIFVLLIVGASNTGGSDALGTIFGILACRLFTFTRSSTR